MFTVAALTPKGGAGKTLATTQIAVRAMDNFPRVAVVDLDPNAGLRIWSAARKTSEMGDMPELFVGVGDPADAVERTKLAGYDFCVLDGAPNSLDGMAEVIDVADVIVIPERCSSNDVQSAAVVAKICRDAGTPAIGMINEVPMPSDKKPYQVGRANSIQAQMEDFGLPVVQICNRDVYLKCREVGVGIHEVSGNVGAAKKEIEALYDLVMVALGAGVDA